MTGRIVALDVGDKRIGIAVCDEGRRIAQPHSVYNRVGFGPDIRYISGLCAQLGTNDVVCGFPCNMDGSVGPQARKVQELAERLKEAGLRVVFQDERLSTVSAEQVLIEGCMRRGARRQTIDKVAAAIILQQYLDTCNNKQEANKLMTDEEMNSVPEEDGNIVELTDDSGVTTKFEYIMTVEHEGSSFVVLMVAQDEDNNQDENEEGEVVILKIEKDPQTGEDIYISIEDDSLLDQVFQKFTKLIDEDDEDIPGDE